MNTAYDTALGLLRQTPVALSGLDKALGTVWGSDGLVKTGIVAPVTIIGKATIKAIDPYATQPRNFIYRNVLKYHKLWRQENFLGTLLQTILYGCANIGNRSLKAHEHSLPHLPLNSLESSVGKFLSSIKPLLPQKIYEQKVALANDFMANEGAILQADLEVYAQEKWAAGTSWMKDFWEEAYFKMKDSVLKTNYFGLDAAPKTLAQNEKTRLDNTATKLYAMLCFIQKANAGTLPAPVYKGAIPLCPHPVTRLFSTTRLPSPEGALDTLMHTPQSKHIAVFSRGRVYKLNVLNEKGYPLPIPYLRRQIAALIEASKAQDAPVVDVGVLTAQPRPAWHKNREELIGLGNKEILEAIETAHFTLSLDDSTPQNLPEAIQAIYKNQNNCWHDKSVQIRLTGTFTGALFEHSGAEATDAVIMAFSIDEIQKNLPIYAYESNETDDDSFEEMSWKLNDDMKNHIQKVHAEVTDKMNEVDIGVHTLPYGTTRIGAFGLSPDAFIQMALQLTYKRIRNEPTSVYESATTRAFKHGRTEMLTPATVQSTEFVDAFDSDVSNEEKEKALRRAAEEHQRLIKECFFGDGFHRHMMALQEMAKRREIKSEFLEDPSHTIPQRLSTSQTPLTNAISEGGCFLPSAQDGFGMSYHPSKASTRMFISSFKGGKAGASSEEFAKKLEETCDEMLTLLDTNQKAKNNKVKA